MKCPIDGSTLVIAERHGVEIDYYPQCRAVWLDRGALEKIVERFVLAAPPPAPPQLPQPGFEEEQPSYKKKKRGGGFLEELFDF